MAKVRAAPNSSTAVGKDVAYPRCPLGAGRAAPAATAAPSPGLHNPRVPDRKAMDAIFFVLRRVDWNALNATGICSSSAAHRHFQE